MERTVEGNGKKMVVRLDPAPLSPRARINLGRIVGTLGTCDIFDYVAENVDKYESWDEWLAAEYGKEFIAVPVYADMREGIRIRTKPFGGAEQVGYIMCQKESVRKHYGYRRVTARLTERVTQDSTLEIEALDAYLNDDHYRIEFNIGGDLVATQESIPASQLESMMQTLPGGWLSHGKKYCRAVFA